MLRLLTIILISTLLGCGRGGAVAPGAGQPGAGGDWFCEMAENAEDWDCVQDPELARSPKPSRLPQPEPPPAPALAAPALDAQAQTQTPGATPPLSEPPPPPPSVAETAATPGSVSTPGPTVPAATATTADLTVAGEETPIHVRLAYHPDEPTPLLNMPADFYAVQLIAMSSRERLEAYIDEHNLVGMSAARVERDGELYFVLILGIYETRALAEQASQDIPPPLDTREPWIRELGTLQDAMLRGNAMAGGALL